jgi:GNAT superfamily N-acetyltransferase
LLRRAFMMLPYKEVERGEMLVAHLAVQPQFWGSGIGRALLAAAEQQARQAGIGRMTLTVEMDNQRARRLYEWVGYRLDIANRTSHLTHLLHTHGFDRLVKDL